VDLEEKRIKISGFQPLQSNLLQVKSRVVEMGGKQLWKLPTTRNSFWVRKTFYKLRLVNCPRARRMAAGNKHQEGEF